MNERGDQNTSIPRRACTRKLTQTNGWLEKGKQREQEGDRLKSWGYSS